MEHGPYDVTRLLEFMRGLVEGGPTASGHRTPAVIVTLPTDGSDEVTFRANAWMVRQVLATGVPGIAFAEWGPGDMGMSLGFPDAHDPPYPPEMQAARNRVLAACKANGIAF